MLMVLHSNPCQRLLEHISLVEVNQALTAWSFRQPTEFFLAHPTGQSGISLRDLPETPYLLSLLSIINWALEAYLGI